MLAAGDPDESRDGLGRLGELRLGDAAVALDRRTEADDRSPLVERLAGARLEPRRGVRTARNG
jgi:hypothetical protein